MSIKMKNNLNSKLKEMNSVVYIIKSNKKE